MKESKFLVVISVLSLIILLVGATFSYFNASTASTTGAVRTKSAILDIDLAVEPIYNEKNLIPMNDSDIFRAYQNNCVDINSYGACHAYLIDISTLGDSVEYQGTVNFDVNGIQHLNYLLLDENDNVYKSQTRITDGTDLSLGDPFTISLNNSRQFKLLIWLSNYEYDQDLEDAGGTYAASVTYSSTDGLQVTGTIVGS